MNNNPAIVDFFKSHDYILKEQENLYKAFKRLGLKGDYQSQEKEKLAQIATDWLLGNNNKLEFLQSLCTRYFPNDHPLPPSLTGCRKKLKTIYVNIWDCVSGSDVHYSDYKSFRKSVCKKPFPKGTAKSLQLAIFLRKL